MLFLSVVVSLTENMWENMGFAVVSSLVKWSGF